MVFPHPFVVHLKTCEWQPPTYLMVGLGEKNVDIECLCTLVVLCGAFAVITSAVSFPG